MYISNAFRIVVSIFIMLFTATIEPAKIYTTQQKIYYFSRFKLFVRLFGWLFCHCLSKLCQLLQIFSREKQHFHQFLRYSPSSRSFALLSAPTHMTRNVSCIQFRPFQCNVTYKCMKSFTFPFAELMCLNSLVDMDTERHIWQ